VSPEQIRTDVLGDAKNPNLVIAPTALAACTGTHAIAVLTEWDEFKTMDYAAIQNVMYKPAFIFDGRNILPHQKLTDLGFRVQAIGKPTLLPK